MLGELNVSQVSHGPCTHLSPFAIKQRRTDSSDIPFLAPGIAAVIDFCLTACDWPCMRHRLNGLCCKKKSFPWIAA